MGGSSDPAAADGVAPVLSVVVPVFDTAEPLIGRALRSAAGIADHGPQVEIVAVDDGSGPACRTYLGRTLDGLASTRVRTVLCTHSENRGLAAARNTGIAAATGQWLFFLDSDDALLPEAVAAMLAEAGDGPEPIICFQNAYATAESDRLAPGPAHRALAEAVTATRAIPATCPELALVPSSWSQAYDRAWLVARGIIFDPALRRWEDRPFLVATQLADPSPIRIHPRVVHRHFLDASGSITKRPRDRRDTAMLLRQIAQVQAAIDEAGLGGTGYDAIHWWLSLSRLLSVAGPGASGDRAAMRTLREAGATLAARAPRDPATGRLCPPHPVLPISRLPAPVRGLLIRALARPRNPLAGLALRAVFRLLDIRRRRGKTLPA